MAFVRNKNYNSMNVTIGKNQLLTKDLKNAIMLEAECAIAYMPAEDKISLALGLVEAPCIDDNQSMARVIGDLRDALANANDIIVQLQANNVSTSAVTTTP